MGESAIENSEYTLLTGQDDNEKVNKPDVGDKKDKASNYKSSIWQSVSNLVSDIEGTGLLALPYVIQRGGLVAIVGLAIVPFICYYTGKILIDCLYVKDSNNKKIRVRTNYKDMAEACWPRYGGHLVFIIQVVELFLLASLYLVLCGSLMNGMLPDVPVSPRAWMTVAACIGLPTLFIKHLSHVAWISLLGVIALTIAVIIILGYGVSTSPHWDISTIPLWDSKGIPIALAIIIFSYICHPVLPTVEANMNDPQRFNIMLVVTYVFVFLIKTVFAVFGFLAFSTNINEVITNSIPLRPVQIAANSFLLLNVFFSYPFRVITIIHCIEGSMESSQANGLLWFVSIRLIINFLALLPAVAIPYFALLMSFVGSLTGMLMVFVLPCAFHLRLRSDDLCWYDKLLDYSVIIFGVVAGAIGIIVSGNNLIQQKV